MEFFRKMEKIHAVWHAKAEQSDSGLAAKSAWAPANGRR
jgi:hypothetical protein